MSYIDDLNQAATEALAASSSATDSAQIMFDVANGADNVTVTTDGGEVKTIAKAIKDVIDSIEAGVEAPQVEPQTLAAGQTTVTLSTMTTEGIALYVEGSREFDFTVTNDTDFELSQSFPDGTRIWIVRRDIEGTADSFTVNTSTGSQTLSNALDNRVVYVNTLADLKTLDTSALVDGQGARITTTGRAGDFTWLAGDQSANVTADPQEGVYVAPDSDATGASGAWVRLYSLRDGILVDWFGAVGDGATDNSVAINAAVSYAQGEVLIPAGDYRLSSGISVKSGITIRGVGYESLLKSSGTNKDVFYGTTVGDIVFDGIRIEGNLTGEGSTTPGEGGYGIRLKDSENVKVMNCHFDDIGRPEGTASSACPINVSGRDVSVTGNIFSENCFNQTGADIAVGQATDTTISNNISKSESDTFISISSNSNPDGTDVVRHSVVGNVAKRKIGTLARSGIIAYYDAQPGYVAISGNSIEGFSWNGVYGSGGVAATTTQDGGGVAISGNVIRFCGGGSGTTGLKSGIYVAGEAGATVTGNFIRDTGYNADGSDRGEATPAIKIVQYAKNVTVTGNTIVKSNGFGVFLSSFDGGIVDVVVSSNTIRDTASSPIRVSSEAAGVQVDGVIISDNLCRHSADVDGILMVTSNGGLNNNVRISGNTLECSAVSATADGIIFNAESGSVTGNTITGYNIGISCIGMVDREIPSVSRVESNHIRDCSTGFAASGKVAIEFGNIYENVVTIYAFRAYGGRPLGDDGTGNLLVEYIDSSSGPFQGPWYRGDRLLIDVPSVDGNNMVKVGRICTASGSVGTWIDQYISTVSPAS